MYKRHHFMLMAALGAALSAGAGAVAQAYEPATPEFPDDGKLRVKHSATGQVCEFDTAEQLDNFGKGIADHADRDSWQLVQRAIPDGVAAQTAGKHIEVDLAQLRADLAADTAAGDATNQLIANGPNPHYAGQFDGESLADAEARRAAAIVAQRPLETEQAAAPAEPAAPAEAETPAATEQPAFINTGAAA